MEEAIKHIQEIIAGQTENLCKEYLKQTGNKIEDCVLCYQLRKDNIYKIWITKKEKIYNPI